MKVKMGMGRRGVRFLEDRREWRLPSLLYTDDLVLCGELEEDLRVILGQFAEMWRRRGLKFSIGKSKVMVLNGEEGLACEAHVNGIHLNHFSEFKYLGCALDESGTDGPECSRKGFVRGNATVVVCHSYMNLLKDGSQSVAEPTT